MAFGPSSYAHLGLSLAWWKKRTKTLRGDFPMAELVAGILAWVEGAVLWQLLWTCQHWCPPSAVRDPD